MAQADILNLVSMGLEVVSPMLEDYTHGASDFARLIKKSEKATKVGRWGYRHPFKLDSGGVFHKLSGNEGTFRAGNHFRSSHLQSSYFYSTISFRLAQEAIDMSASSEQSVENVLSRQIADAMDVAVQHQDVALHTSGNGIISNGISTPAPSGGGTASTSMTLSAAGDYLRTAQLIKGGSVDIWSQDLSTKRNTSPSRIMTIDPAAGTITVDAAVTINPAGSNDVIALCDMDAYGPATPTTFSSGYPIAVGSQLGTGMAAAGVGGDSFRHGIRYWNDVTDANYFYSRLKSGQPDLKANRVNAGGAALNWSHGRIGQDKILARYQNNSQINLLGLANTAQISAIENLDIAATAIFQSRGQASTTTTDLAGYTRSLGRAVPYCGLTVYADGRQAHDRVDFWSPDCIYKVQMYETRFKPGGDTGQNYLFMVRDTNGRPVNAVEFFIEECFDWFCAFPGKNFYIDSLEVAADYIT
jgi:hypothetical protein